MPLISLYIEAGFLTMIATFRLFKNAIDYAFRLKRCNPMPYIMALRKGITQETFLTP